MISNAYAEKVFSEHPLVLFPLDDSVDYLSLITETQRDMSLWTANGGTADGDSYVSGQEPFKDTKTFYLENSASSDEMSFTGPVVVSPTLVNNDLKSVSISAYVNDINGYVEYIEIGFLSGVVQDITRYSNIAQDDWSLISHTIQSVSGSLSPYIKVKLIDDAPTEVLVNGISVGQWSEEFSSKSLGVDSSSVQQVTGILSEAFSGISTNEYGIGNLNGYYVVSDKSLLAKNTSVPLVYGSTSLTKILPNASGKPSLILPSAGFLTASGKSSEYTAEFWLRIDPYTDSPRKIFGPIDSSDGLYVFGPYMSLVIGSSSASYFVSEWYRPMLIDIAVNRTLASLMINGEVVLSIDIDRSEIDENIVEWLGFYSYDGIESFEIDCFGVYPYLVPSVVAKRRFVYGQAVEIPDDTIIANGGQSIAFESGSTKYANVYSYPDIGIWQQGVLENFEVVNNALSSSTYSPPIAQFNNQSQDKWLLDVSELETPSLTLRPNRFWNNTEGHLYFRELSLSKQNAKAVYGVFEVPPNYSGQTILMRIENAATRNYLSVDLSGTSVQYSFVSNGVEKTLFSSDSVVLGSDIAVGIDFQKLSIAYGGDIASFIENIAKSKLYVGNSSKLESGKTFPGRIGRIGISNNRDYAKISGLFNQDGFIESELVEYDGGTASQSAWESELDGGVPTSRFNTYEGTVEQILLEHPGTYSVQPMSMYGNFLIDVSVSSEWEDYIPLIYFAKNVIGSDGDSRYDLDFLQFNIDVPRTNVVTNGVYDTSLSPVKTYISFQYISTGANKLKSEFLAIEPLSESNTVVPDSSWPTTRYEVMNDTIIYPPANVSFNDLAIVINVEASVAGVRSLPLNIKRLKLSSVALNETQPTPIGTRSGINVYPYRKTGFYITYSSRNPYIIQNDDSPHLYLTKSSGIKILNREIQEFNEGISIPINESRDKKFMFSGIQLSIFADKIFDYGTVVIAEIQSAKDYVQIFAEPFHADGKRARLYAVNANTGKRLTDAVFFINGKPATIPVITAYEWAMVGIGFVGAIDFNESSGSFRLNGPLRTANISFYRQTPEQQLKSAIYRTWADVKFAGDGSERDWQFWKNFYTWQTMLVSKPERYPGANPEKLYSAFTGTEVITVNSDESLLFGDYQFITYSSQGSETITILPV